MLQATSLIDDVRERRIWYNDIELSPELRTRFDEDYDANPALRAVDEGNRSTLAWLRNRCEQDIRGQTVLDLGCADGLYSFWAARCGAEHVVGVERNQYNFERAQWLRSVLGLRNVSFVCGGIEKHTPDKVFDYVFCFNLLYHLIEPLSTLFQLRRRCKKELLLVTAIDFCGTEDEPVMRLDRYANGAHGVWSFNRAMVRQLLTTAGFDIAEESFEQRIGCGRYTAICRPGSFESHHIFAEKIDQEFPIHVERRRQHVRKVWKTLPAKVQGPIAIFGAGTHTPWLLKQVEDIPGVEVACILDDRIPLSKTIGNLPVLTPQSASQATFSAVVLSSWHQSEALRKRAAAVFPGNIQLISLDQ